MERKPVEPMVLPDRNDKTLTLVREIGFDIVHDLEAGRTTEKIFFLGPHLLAGREEGAHATEAAIKDFIAYWENQIEVARDYLLNGRENRTHRWTQTVRPPEPDPSIGLRGAFSEDLFNADGSPVTVEQMHEREAADGARFGVWITTHHWAAVFGGDDWVGSRAQADARAARWGVQCSTGMPLGTAYAGPPEISYEVRPYTGTTPASDKDLALEEESFQRTSITQREILEAGKFAHLGDDLGAAMQTAMTEESPYSPHPGENLGPSMIEHRDRMLGLRGHCPACGAKPGEPCRKAMLR